MYRIIALATAFLMGFCCRLALAQESPATAAPAAQGTSAPAQTPAWQPDPEHSVILEEISSAIGPSALENITGAEQVFCYQITNRPENYTGYTLDGMAIVGFCGIINNELKTMITSELFMNPDNIVFDVTENCIIRPKVMLRFVRGVDSTDVLLSSPCHAFAIFYGGKVNAFNAKPAAQIIDALVNPLIKGKVDFASPALFNQLLPIGVAQTEEQKRMLEQKNEPIRNWVKSQEENEAANTKKGWNKLNLKLQK